LSAVSAHDLLLSSIYSAATEPDLWPEVLARLAEVVGAEAVFFGHVPAARMWEGEVWSHGFDPVNVEAMMRPEAIGASVPVRACLTLPECVPVDLAGAITTELLREDPGGRALLAPQGLLAGCFGPILHENEVLTAIGCLNDPRRPGVELGCVRAIMPHLRRASAIARRVAALEVERGRLVAALDGLAVGVMVVDDSLGLVHANGVAERALAARDGVARRRGRVVLADPAADRWLAREAARAAAGAPDAGAPVRPVPRPSGARSYTLCVAPNGSRTATIYLDDPEAGRRAPEAADLAERYGLTATEAEVARLAALGGGMPHVARTLGVSVNTVRSHLKAIYGKTGLNSQAALAREMATTMPPVQANGRRRPAG
jgi:DNA-binding CsgD family transcriptional regulator